MEILRKEVPIEINGVNYKFILDFGAAIHFQKLYGKSILVGLEEISQNQDIEALGYLVASCLKTGEGKDEKSVGVEFINELDFISSLPMFMEVLPKLVENSLPKDTEENIAKKK